MPRRNQSQNQSQTQQADETTRSKRGRAAARTFTPIPAGALIHQAVPDTEFVSFATESSRTDDQKTIDSAVETTYKAWTDAGRPQFTRASLSRPGCPAPREKFIFPPEHTEAIQYMLERAGQLYGLAVVKSPISRSEDGNAILYWSVKDRSSRPRSGGQPAKEEKNEKTSGTGEVKASPEASGEPEPDTE